MWITIIAGLYAIIFGAMRIHKGIRIFTTRSYSFREKNIFGPRRKITRTGEATTAYGIAAVLSGVASICVVGALVANKIFDPLSLVVFPLLVAGLIEIPGVYLSERNFVKIEK
jgi:hypothetical protein